MGGGGGGGRFMGTIGAGGAFSGGTLYAAANTGIMTDAGGGSGGGGSAELTFVEAVASGIGNFKDSGQKFISSLYEAVTSPKQTVEGLCNIIAGYACEVSGVDSDYRRYSDKVTEFFAERYGSYKNFKQTLATDPVGLAGDFSTFLTFGGGALRGLAKVSTVATKALPAGGTIAKGVESSAAALKKAGTALGTAGTSTDPLYQAGKAAGKAIGKLPDSMQKKIKKIPKSGTVASRARAIVNIGGTQQAIDKKGEENKGGK